MNIIITTVGTWGDVLPYIAIGTELQKRENDVVILTNSKYESAIRKAGIKFHSIGDEKELDEAMTYVVNVLSAWGEPEGKGSLKKHYEVGRRVFLNSTRQIYDYVNAHNEPDNTLLISNYLCYGSRYVQDKLNINAITVVLAPSYFRSKIRPTVHQVNLEWMPKSLRSAAVSLAQDVMFFNPIFKGFKDGDIDMKKYAEYSQRFSPDKVICMAPEWFTKPQADWVPNSKSIGFPFYEGEQNQELPKDVEEFLKEGSPPIIFNSGSKLRKSDTFYIEAALACEKMGMRGIFIGRPDREISVKLPDCVRDFKYIPLSSILPKSAAMVYHGGIGTCALGMQAGIPHLIVPEFNEHFDIGEQVKRLGIGDLLNRNEYNADTVVNKLDRLLKSKDVADNCKKVANMIGTKDSIYDTLSTFCDEVEELAERRGMLKRELEVI